MGYNKKYFCLTQGDQGLPGEVGAPGERGAGDPGAKVGLSPAVKSTSAETIYSFPEFKVSICESVLRASQDHRECQVCQGCQERTEPLDRR